MTVVDGCRRALRRARWSRTSRTPTARVLLVERACRSAWRSVVASFAPTLAVFVFLIAFVGAGQITFLATCNSTVQLDAEPSMRGRVMAVYTITMLGTTPIGGPLVGWISEEFGPRYGFAIGGIATLAGTLVFGTASASAPTRRAIARTNRRQPDQAHELVLGIDGESIAASVVR